MKEVDLVLGNVEKLNPQSYADFGISSSERVRVNDIMSVRETASQMVDSFDGRIRAFLQVQNGCDHRCTFCVIPYGRGNSRSVPMGAVIDEARSLAAVGTPEIVLSGVDLTAYGKDLPGEPSLGLLVRKLLKLVPQIQRLRLSSIDSIETDPELMSVIAEEGRLMPHFHLSVQSGDDLILRRMKRRHRRADTIRFCDAVRKLRPEAAFGADFIVGFPTETEDMFQQTANLVEEAGLSMLHVFRFSARAGTPAARMPQVERPLAKDRARRLRAKGQEMLATRYARLAGSTQRLLLENNHLGRTECFAPVRVHGGASGSLVTAKLTADAGGELWATL